MSFSWETHSAASAPASVAPVTTSVGIAWRTPAWARSLARRAPRPELVGLIVLAGVLNLWALSRNGWANDYYSAAVRSMSSSWHNFLYASFDQSGVMTVDKPPLALWVQSLSVRAFGYHPLSVLLPQALMGVASVALVYDLVRRRFGRVGGFVAGLALAVTPITVAISRHNNPDALLVLCCVAALWCTVRALEGGRTRWLVLAGVCVGLGFETKMGVALVVVPGIAAAWLWLAPAARTLKGTGGRVHALRQLLAGGAAMVIVGGAWPALVELTPAADRPWVAGTSDNSVLSLIFGYNGLGRVEGQSGGPGGGGGNLFGSTPGPLRLVNSALGGQAGWLLGFALATGLGMLIASRLRRSDPRTGWLIAVGGAFVTTAVLFSAASGIFHPYYVSLLAPFAAALVGAGAAQLIGGGLNARVIGPLAVAAGVATELVVLGDYPGQLSWLPPVLIAVGALAALTLAVRNKPRARLLAVGAALAALLVAPSVWAFDTLGHTTSGTFPAGGPTLATSDGPGGAFGGFAGRAGGRPFSSGSAEGVQLFGSKGSSRSRSTSQSSSSGQGSAEGFGAGQAGGPPSGTGSAPGAGPGGPSAAGAAGEAPPSAPPGISGGAGPAGLGGGGGGGGAVGAPFGNDRSINQVVAYVKEHGGGTIAVSSQSSAAQAIIASDANVAGVGGFSGRESDVSTSWLAEKVRTGSIRWVLVEQAGGTGGGPGLPGDTRAGAKAAMKAVARACQAVVVPASAGSSGGRSGASTLYDCKGRSQALARASG
jgi:4-amino-4-deoxy-L-arabinose transferase-like glycosyltransferase